MTRLLEVEDLAVRYDDVQALDGVSLSLDRGQSLVVVGESGAGKSTLARCLAGLVQPPRASGSVRIDGQQLMGAEDDVLRAVRWSRVALSLQGAPFNPVMTIGDQIAEPLRLRAGLGAAAARSRASALADELLLDELVLSRHPHELSGGERQHAAMVMALALDPDLLVLDEPVAGLDPPARLALMERLAEVVRRRGLAVVAVAHNVAEASRLGARTLVLYGGQTMETGVSSSVLKEPAHPYSWALVNAQPRMSTTKDLRPIRGHAPDPRVVPPGCPFHPRCTQAEAVCAAERPALVVTEDRSVACHFGGLKILLHASGLRKRFGSGTLAVDALADVSLRLRHGESVGVIGPSGSGKSTLARILTGDLSPDGGEVQLEGAALGARDTQQRMQLVRQDPWDALSPRLPVLELVREPLDLAGGGRPGERDAAVTATLESVGLPTSPGFLGAFVHELSGGELQRISTARALLAAPAVIVADEPTSMLDPSEQARLLLVLRERQIAHGLGLILISHEMALVRKFVDRIVVLDAGRVVEEGRSDVVGTTPASATARAMTDAARALE